MCFNFSVIQLNICINAGSKLKADFNTTKSRMFACMKTSPARVNKSSLCLKSSMIKKKEHPNEKRNYSHI